MAMRIWVLFAVRNVLEKEGAAVLSSNWQHSVIGRVHGQHDAFATLVFAGPDRWCRVRCKCAHAQPAGSSQRRSVRIR